MTSAPTDNSTVSSSAIAAVRGAPLESGVPKFHNDMAGLQGGLEADGSDPAEFYHLTAAEYAALGGGPGGGHVIVNPADAEMPAEPHLKFDGDGVTVTDIPGSNQTLVEIAGGGGGHEIIDESGTPMDQEPAMQFTGNVEVTDDAGVKTIVNIPAPSAGVNKFRVDCSGGTGDTFGVLGGAVNGINTTFTVSEAVYISGSLQVYRNGQLLTQGSSEDWHEHDPSTGVFHFAIAPLATDVIVVTYFITDVDSLVGMVEEAPDNGVPYVRKGEAWVPEAYICMDQSGGTGDTYGALGGVLNGVNTDFTVSRDAYLSGTLQVLLNGMLQIQGTAEDWQELSAAAGTFRFNTAPAATDQITVIYGYSGAITIVGDKHIIQDNGSNMTARAKLDFLGTIVTDNSGADRTEVDASKVQHAQFIFTIESANLAVANQGVKPLKFRVPYVGAGAVIEEIYVQLGTTPGAANIRIDIHKNGATVNNTTAYVEIAVGDTTASRTTNFVGGGALAKDDYLQLELVQGDATAADLVVHVRYKWTLTNV
jgi:hypothetical protein